MTVLPVTLTVCGSVFSRSRLSDWWWWGTGAGGHLADEPPVGLLGEGRGGCPRCETGLDVEDGYLVVESRQRSGEGGGGVPLDDDGVGPVGLNGPPHPLQAAVGDLGEGLSR